MTDLAVKVRFGPVVVAVSADEELRSAFRTLEQWLSAGRCGEDEPPDLELHLVPERSGPPRAEGESLVAGDASLSDRALTVWDGRAWEASTDLHHAGSGPRRWTFTGRRGPLLRTLGLLPKPLFRFLHVHRFSPEEVKASTFLYRHLIPLVQGQLLDRGATFVHASALAHSDGQGLLLSGWGGSGKTSGSAALYLSKPRRWSFLSDDLAVLDTDGRIHFSPIPLNVFPYSADRFEPLHERVVRPMGFFDRLQWNLRKRILGGGGVARRVPPWTDASVTGSSLELCVHLQRSDRDEPIVRECEPAVIARICGNVLMYELRHSLSIHTAANAFCVDSEPPLPTMGELARGAEGVLAEALRDRRTVVATVPGSVTVEELGTLIERLWDENRRAGS